MHELIHLILFAVAVFSCYCFGFYVGRAMELKKQIDALKKKEEKKQSAHNFLKNNYGVLN